MNFDVKQEVLGAAIDKISREQNDVFSYYIKSDDIRDYVCRELRKKGLVTIDSQHNSHIYVDLKVDL